MLDTAKAFSLCPLPRRDRTAVISAQAGLGIIACDLREEEDLTMAVFTEETIQRMKEMLFLFSIRNHLLDMCPALYNWETYREVIKTFCMDKNVDALIIIAASASANEPNIREIAKTLKTIARQKPVVTCFSSPGKYLAVREERT